MKKSIFFSLFLASFFLTSFILYISWVYDNSIFSYLIEIIIAIFLVIWFIILFSKKIRKKIIPDELAWQANARASNLAIWVMFIMSFASLVLYRTNILPISDLQNPQIIVWFIVLPTILVLGISYNYFLKNPINEN